MLTPRDLLVDLKETFSDPSKFTTGAYARDIYGNPVTVDEETAVRFCTVGRLDHIIKKHKVDRTVLYTAMKLLQNTSIYKLWLTENHIIEASIITTFNDECGRSAILKAVDEALTTT